MKTLLKRMSFIFAMTVLLNCTEDEPLKSEKVQFTFALSDPDSPDGGRVKNANIPDGTFLQISLETTSGVPVITNHKVNLLKLGNNIVTDPFELLPNHYIVTDFMLIHNSQILYVCPRKGSPLAQAVINPLPFGFTVMKNKVTTVEIEVMDAKLHTPKELGYGSFNINVKNAFQLSVFSASGGLPNLTSASVSLYQDGKLIESWNVDAKINLLSFGGQPEFKYTLVVEKNYHIQFTRTFYINELLAETGNLPFKVTLNPIMSMFVHASEEAGNEFWLHFSGDEMGYVNVKWGDGKSETVRYGLYHVYPREGYYVVTLTGDLHEIKTLRAAYNLTEMEHINLQHLTGLEDFDFAWTRGPAVVDLSHNTKLKALTLAGVDSVKQIILPATHQISFVRVSGSPRLDGADIDALVENVYNNTRAKNIRQGNFILAASWDQNPSEDLTMLGPPSAESIAKLKELKFNYGWYITPDLWGD